jgi:hypothetical protein
MKSIERHPLVDEVETDWGGNKKYFVHLKPGYWFATYETGSKSFNSYAEFKEAVIEKRTDGE